MELDDKDKELLFAWMRRLEGKIDSLATGFEGVRDGLHTVERRLASVEQQVAGMRADLNHQWEQFAAHALRLERLELRAGLIEGDNHVSQ